MSAQEVTAAAVADAIRDATNEPVHVEMTGGHVATIYVGAYDHEGRATLAIGPGSYNYGDPWSSTFYLGDLAIGPDDDSGDYVNADTLADVTAAIRAALG